MPSTPVIFLGVLLAVAGYVAYDNLKDVDILSTFDENIVLSHWMIQAALFGFCLNTEALDNLLEKDDAENFDMHQADMEKTDFENDGNINEDDYTKQSIYSVLYSVYADLENLAHRGEKYQFRFNTWGVTGVMCSLKSPCPGGITDDRIKRGTKAMSVGTENAEGAAKNKNNLLAYPETQPQKAGKIAYSSLLNFEATKEFLAKKRAEIKSACDARGDKECVCKGPTDKSKQACDFDANPDCEATSTHLGGQNCINMVEIGSGTGAGANELTWLHPYINYIAIDMQAPGTNLCKKIHMVKRLIAPQPANDAKPKKEGTFEELIAWDHRLSCFQHNGQYIKQFLPAEFADIVLISETHIADVVPFDIETQRVFEQMHRLLKPGGYFVWGNAIPTSIWEGSFRFLQNTLKMTRKEVHDVTDNAVIARDDDYSRAIDFFRQAKETYFGLGWFPACSWSVNRLIMNFYRQPGTALYKRMLVNSNVTKPLYEHDGKCDNNKQCWCTELKVPTSLCDDRRIDSYVHMAYMK